MTKQVSKAKLLDDRRRINLALMTSLPTEKKTMCQEHQVISKTKLLDDRRRIDLALMTSSATEKKTMCQDH